jgi:hypothetical protein
MPAHKKKYPRFGRFQIRVNRIEIDMIEALKAENKSVANILRAALREAFLKLGEER